MTMPYLCSKRYAGNRGMIIDSYGADSNYPGEKFDEFLRNIPFMKVTNSIFKYPIILIFKPLTVSIKIKLILPLLENQFTVL
jgi:hypothetical protein